MPRTAVSTMANNIEEVLCEHYGADEATASLKYDLGDDDYVFDVFYEGVVEDLNLTYVVKDSMGWQMIEFNPHKYEKDNKLGALYVYLTEENAADLEIEGQALIDLEDELDRKMQKMVGEVTEE